MIRKILVDVNVFEDILSGRNEELYSSKMVNIAKDQMIEGWISANSHDVENHFSTIEKKLYPNF